MRSTPRFGTVRALGRAVVMLGSLVGCGGAPATSDVEPTTSDGATTAAASSPTTAASTSPSTTTAADDATLDTTSNDSSMMWLPKTDGPSIECDLFAQDCPPGEKCTVWSSDGTPPHDAAACRPVVAEPRGPGEPCHVERSPASGFDDCVLGAVCWYVDPETLQGVCMAYCVGGEKDLHCEDPASSCAVYGDTFTPLCIPPCSPLEQECIDGFGCYFLVDQWQCHPDGSGVTGSYGDPCNLFHECDPGLVCLDASAVPPGRACENAQGCCTEVCDLGDPAGDLQCTGAIEGSICQPWYEDGTAPVGYENVGVCVLPV